MNGTDTSAPPSLQPLAPQAPGNVLYGRFGKMSNHMQTNWKMYATVAVVILLAWWLWKRFK